MRVHTQFHRAPSSAHTTKRFEVQEHPGGGPPPSTSPATHPRPPPRPSSPLGQSWKGPSRKRIGGEKWLGTDEKRTDGRGTEHVVYSNPILRHNHKSSHPAHVLWPHSQPLRFTLDSPPFVVLPPSPSLARFLLFRLSRFSSSFFDPPSLSLSLSSSPLHRETSEAINPPSYNVLTTFRETCTGTRG